MNRQDAKDTKNEERRVKREGGKGEGSIPQTISVRGKTKRPRGISSGAVMAVWDQL
jgi:hypothetical protein